MSLTRTDRDHLRTLAVCHYVLGGLHFFFGLFPIIYLVIGIVIVTEAPNVPQPNGARQNRGTGPPNHVVENVWNSPCGNGSSLLIGLDQPV